MALEGGDHFHGRRVVFSADRDAVAILCEGLLQVADVIADGAELEGFAAHDRRRMHPMADAGIGQRMPREFLAGVFLARWRDVRMPEHAMWRHLAAEHDAT